MSAKNFLNTAAWLAVSLSCAASSSWPQWRGPSRDGRVEAPAWPSSLDEQHLRPRWRVELGPSYSGPIVAPDRVFTTETRDAKSEVVRALDRATGKELWKTEWEGAMKVPFFAKSNGDWIRSTPAWDGESLFVSGMRDVLVAIDASSGKVRWKHDFPAQDGTPVPAFGYVSSPLVDGDALYTQAGGAVVRLDKKSGETQWKALATTDSMNGSAFSSPIIAHVAGQRQLVVQTRTHLAGLDLATGAELWSTPVEAFRGMNILTPTPVSSNRIFTSTYGGKTLAFDVARDGDRFSVKPAWSFKAQGYMTSPILHDGHAYLHLRNQRALCVSLDDGAEKWTTTESFGKYWSLVANRDRILALDERGILMLMAASPAKHEVLSKRKVGDDTWAHLAVAGNEVFIRELKALAAYDWSEPRN